VLLCRLDMFVVLNDICDIPRGHSDTASQVVKRGWDRPDTRGGLVCALPLMKKLQKKKYVSLHMHIESVENKDNAKVSPPPTPPTTAFSLVFYTYFFYTSTMVWNCSKHGTTYKAGFAMHVSWLLAYTMLVTDNTWLCPDSLLGSCWYQVTEVLSVEAWHVRCLVANELVIHDFDTSQ